MAVTGAAPDRRDPVPTTDTQAQPRSPRFTASAPALLHARTSSRAETPTTEGHDFTEQDAIAPSRQPLTVPDDDEDGEA